MTCFSWPLRDVPLWQRVGFWWGATAVLVIACEQHHNTPLQVAAAVVSASVSASASAVEPASSGSAVGLQEGPPSPFTLITEGRIDVYPLHGGSIAVGPGEGSLDVEGNFNFDGSLSLPEVNAGYASTLVGAVGRWPSPVYGIHLIAWGRLGRSELLRRSSATWVKAHPSSDDYLIQSAALYLHQSVLLLEESTKGPGYRFRVFETGVPVAPPAPSPWVPGDETLRGASRVVPSAMLAFETGEIFVVGGDSKADSGTLEPFIVERFSASGKAFIDPLPNPQQSGGFVAGRGSTIVGRSPSDVWVAAWWNDFKKESSGVYLIHFDGRKWIRVDVPFGKGLTLGGIDSKGSLWGTVDKNIWKRASNGVWEQQHLPVKWPLEKGALVAVQKVTVTEDDNVIVNVMVSEPPDPRHIPVEQENYTLALKKPSKPIDIPSDETFRKRAQRASLPQAYYRGCPHPFVLLYELSKSAPAGYDFPATRKALAGHTEFNSASFVEYALNGRRYFGAQFPAEQGLGWELPKQMVAVVQKGVPGSTPQMVCYHAEPSRVLDINLKTGALQP